MKIGEEHLLGYIEQPVPCSGRYPSETPLGEGMNATAMVDRERIGIAWHTKVKANGVADEGGGERSAMKLCRYMSELYMLPGLQMWPGTSG